jgi:hypothetical protein
MAQSTPQFTAAQILEAGRRAEADGRVEYAVQFYRHLTDHHGRAPEAAAARDGLARLANRRPAEPPPQMNGHHPAPGPSAGAADVLSGAPQGVASAGVAPPPLPELARRSPPPMVPATAPPQAVPASAQLPTPQTGRAIAISPVGPRAVAAAVPPPADGYRMGRLLARLLTGVGWLTTASGVIALALSVAALFVPAAAAALGSAGKMLGPAASVGGILSGLTIIFLGQVARALFDTANATRDLAAVERARSEQG